MKPDPRYTIVTLDEAAIAIQQGKRVRGCHNVEEGYRLIGDIRDAPSWSPVNVQWGSILSSDTCVLVDNDPASEQPMPTTATATAPKILRLSLASCELFCLDEDQGQAARGLRHLHTARSWMTFAGDEQSLKALRTEFLVADSTMDVGVDPNNTILGRAVRSINCALGEFPRSL